MQNGKSNSIEKNKTRHNSWDNWLLEGWGSGPSGYELSSATLCNIVKR